MGNFFIKEKKEKGNRTGQNDLYAPFSCLLFFFRLAGECPTGKFFTPFFNLSFLFLAKPILQNVVFKPVSILISISCARLFHFFDLTRVVQAKKEFPDHTSKKKRFAMKRASCKSSTENQDTNATLLKITVKTRYVEGNMGKTSVIRAEGQEG